eukprot:578470_1
MAAPAANTNTSTTAVDKLTTMFPTIERATIQNIVVNECGGDTTKSIVILTKIQQFNNSNANANNDTVNAGEVVQPTAAVSQQIPLQVHAPHAVANPSAGSDCADCNDCCGSNSCACCLMKPASYKKGLYPIDYQMYTLSFFLFAVFTVYPDATLDELSPTIASNYALYLPVAGLSLIIVGALLQCVPNISGTIRGGLYIFGGLLYSLGYIIHAAAVPDNQYYWWRYYYSVTPEYLVGRGLFVGIHAMFIGYLNVTKNKLPDVMSSRVSLIRFWTLLFLVYHLLVVGDEIYDRLSLVALTALSPLIVAVSLLLNCCLLNESNEKGGCNCGVTLGLLIVISYYFMMGWLAILLVSTSYYGNGWLLIWKIGVWVFGSMQLWILSRAMHPANANCGCAHDGSGDGDINVSPEPYPSGQTQTVVVVAAPSETQPIAAPAEVN